ncbi:translation initiation factor IF-2-like [Panicum virgatum]|uniref:translation initiation factor IF-2-like n=1 Tax=Panicum virgatum TaxID=38727 RepID=UPI0019D5608D|nr:translation initiation factor IF-2-like [Panicum virgatum]
MEVRPLEVDGGPAARGRWRFGGRSSRSGPRVAAPQPPRPPCRRSSSRPPPPVSPPTVPPPPRSRTRGLRGAFLPSSVPSAREPRRPRSSPALESPAAPEARGRDHRPWSRGPAPGGGPRVGGCGPRGGGAAVEQSMGRRASAAAASTAARVAGAGLGAAGSGLPRRPVLPCARSSLLPRPTSFSLPCARGGRGLCFVRTRRQEHDGPWRRRRPSSLPSPTVSTLLLPAPALAPASVLRLRHSLLAARICLRGLNYQ